jgi:hypothetical protein
MSQELTVNIKATSNVPEAMDKAKSATVSMGKQVEDVQKKFSTGLKDVFLAFTAPLVIFNSILNMIGSAIDKRKADIADAISLAEKGESKYISRELSTQAQYVQQQETDKKEKELASKAATEVAQKQLDQGATWGGTGDEVIAELWKGGQWAKAAGMYTGLEDMASDKDVQKILQRKAKEGLNTMEATGTDLRTQQGLSNVVGVGANPVVEAMTAQLEEQRRQTQLLEEIANHANGGTDFTKEETPGAMKATPYGL